MRRCIQVVDHLRTDCGLCRNQLDGASASRASRSITVNKATDLSKGLSVSAFAADLLALASPGSASAACRRNSRIRPPDWLHWRLDNRCRHTPRAVGPDECDRHTRPPAGRQSVRWPVLDDSVRDDKPSQRTIGRPRERMDCGTPRTAGAGNQGMAAMGTRDRPAKRGPTGSNCAIARSIPASFERMG